MKSHVVDVRVVDIQRKRLSDKQKHYVRKRARLHLPLLTDRKPTFHLPFRYTRCELRGRTAPSSASIANIRCFSSSRRVFAFSFSRRSKNDDAAISKLGVSASRAKRNNRFLCCFFSSLIWPFSQAKLYEIFPYTQDSGIPAIPGPREQTNEREFFMRRLLLAKIFGRVQILSAEKKAKKIENFCQVIY